MYFIADLHLTDARPAATGRFLRFLDEDLREAAALFILGDLFEAWPGDDHREHVGEATATALRRLAQQGTQIYFMPGNRDFMLADGYARRACMTRIEDPTPIELFGVPTLLLHGDLLCRDDVAYQRFRRVVRRKPVMRALGALPYALRARLAQGARAGSESAKSAKPAAIMDAHPDAVLDYARRYGAARLIHGHTHRPGHHAHPDSGRMLERWVVPDWYTRWGYVACSAAGCRLEVAPLAAG